MLNVPDFAPFLRDLAQKLNPACAELPPSEDPIYCEFRSKADLEAAAQHCGASEHIFEVIANDELVRRQKRLFSDLEGRLIAANIRGGNILVDGSPLPGFFHWHSNGKSTLVQLPEEGVDAESLQAGATDEEELATVGRKQLGSEACPRASSAAEGCEIPRGELTEDQIRQWLAWIDVAALEEDTLQRIRRALHHYLDGSNAGLRLWHDLCRRSPSYEHAAREQEYRKLGSAGQERSTINIVYDVAFSGLIKNLNAQIAWRMDSTNSAIYQLVAKQVISVTPVKLTNEYRNRMFPKLTNGVVKLENPIAIWQSHPDRRDVYGLCAENSPEVFIKRPEGGYLLNIFRGLADPGEAGQCERFKQFLFEVICSGRSEIFEWVWKWLAWVVQNPTKPPLTAIMLNGRQGTGKNLFYGYFAKAIGEDNCYLTHTSEELLAKHNQLFQGRRLCCADEAYFESDPRQRNEMKGKITGDSITVNPKGVSQYLVPNMAAWLFLSNSEKSPENSDDGRRITYLTPSDQYIPMHGREASDAYYSPIYEERDGNGPASLLRELLDTDLTGFKPYPKLTTPEGLIAAKHGDLGDNEWFREIVETGEFRMLVTQRSDGHYMVHQTYAKEYALEHQRKRNKRVNDQAAGVLFKKLGFEKGGKGHKFWIIPPLVDVRKAWILKVTLTPDFLDHPDWESDAWEV